MSETPIQDLADKIHANAVAKGFWDKPRNFGEMTALTISELIEALEEHRNGKPAVYFGESHLREDGKAEEDSMGNWTPRSFVRKPEGVAVEMVDAAIRILDTTADLLKETGWTIDDILELKMDYNATRPHMHGKAY